MKTGSQQDKGIRVIETFIRHDVNELRVFITRVGRGDANHGIETSAPVEDGVGEMGVYVGSFRATYLARHSQQRERVANEKGARDSGSEC